MGSLNPAITDWPAQRVWIIGASTGIGAAMALDLLARGTRVAASARNEQGLREVCAGRPNALVVPADVTRIDTLEAAYRAIVAAWGGVDLVVFMAGNYFPARAWELSPAKSRTQIDTNIIGVLDGLSIVLPDLIARGGGGVVIVSSVAGYRGLPNSLLYGATKAALINLAESLYIDLADRGVGVYLVNPGFVKTPLTADNSFEMPNLITPEEASTALLAGLERGEFEIHFPKAFTRKLKFARLLPYWLYFRLIKRSTGL